MPLTAVLDIVLLLAQWMARTQRNTGVSNVPTHGAGCIVATAFIRTSTVRR